MSQPIDAVEMLVFYFNFRGGKPSLIQIHLENLDEYLFLKKGNPGYTKYWDLLYEREAIRKFHHLGTPFAWRSNKKSSVVWAQATNLTRLHLALSRPFASSTISSWLAARSSRTAKVLPNSSSTIACSKRFKQSNSQLRKNLLPIFWILQISPIFSEPTAVKINAQLLAWLVINRSSNYREQSRHVSSCRSFLDLLLLFFCAWVL